MRYRATATIVWDFDTPLPHKDAQELANKHLSDIPTQDGLSDMRLVVRIDKLKEKVEKVRLGEFKIEEVIPFITKEETKREYEYDGAKHAVRMNSHRYFIFRECMNCVACGLKGTRMFLECHLADKSPHFNLYGEEDGKLVLMTKDHIHAKACGGEDRHSNYQTMCLVCNNLKGHAHLTLDGVRELRSLYNENKNKVTKKKLHSLIEEAKARLEKKPEPKVPGQRKRKLAKVKATADALVATCDINVYQDKAGLYGKSVYDKIDPLDEHVACIKKGTLLEPLLATRDKILCKLGDDDVVIIYQSLLKAKE